MKTLLRAARAADARRVAEILIASRQAFLPYARSPHPEAQIHQWVREVLIPSERVVAATVVGDGVGDVFEDIVGVLATALDHPHSWIDQLCLHPTHVGQGIGSLLLAHALASVPAPVRLYTFQQNARARTFYERHGFVAIEFTDGRSNEEKCPDVLYEWPARAAPRASPR